MTAPTPQQFVNSNAGAVRLGKALGRSVPRSVVNTANAMHGLQRLIRRHS